MPSYVTFQLHGTLAAWGEIAVGENRPTGDHPSRSALLGLVAAAMGIRRTDEERHTALSSALSFAVAVVEAGTLVRDYHTVQVPSQGKHMVGVTRRRELQNAGMNTIVSTRDYRCDAWYLVAVSVQPNSNVIDPERLAASLRTPVFVPYLGRKSCPPSLPFNPLVVEAASVAELFEDRKIGENEGRSQNRPVQALTVYCDPGMEEGLTDCVELTRRDEPLARSRWQFGTRVELRGYLPPKGGTHAD